MLNESSDHHYPEGLTGSSIDVIPFMSLWLIVNMLDFLKQCVDQRDDRNRAGYKRGGKPLDKLSNS